MSLKKWLGLEVLENLGRIVKQNGGLRGTLWTLFRTDTLKLGTLVGTDKYGNKYYQNDKYFVPRNRWVVHSESTFMEYDGSQIPAEWHNWLHYVCDDPPTENPRVNYKWMIDHRENLSGSNKSYVPYSTTSEKVKTWIPQGSQDRIRIGQLK